jgi:hypothetical protein
MKRMYDYACKCGQKFEKFTTYEMVNVQCECGELAVRALSAPAFRLEGWSGSFPSAYGRFPKSHTDKLKSERKANAQT